MSIYFRLANLTQEEVNSYLVSGYKLVSVSSRYGSVDTIYHFVHKDFA
jgi:hypothetical protein